MLDGLIPSSFGVGLRILTYTARVSPMDCCCEGLRNPHQLDLAAVGGAEIDKSGGLDVVDRSRTD